MFVDVRRLQRQNKETRDRLTSMRSDNTELDRQNLLFNEQIRAARQRAREQLDAELLPLLSARERVPSKAAQAVFLTKSLVLSLSSDFALIEETSRRAGATSAIQVLHGALDSLKRTLCGVSGKHCHQSRWPITEAVVQSLEKTHWKAILRQLKVLVVAWDLLEPRSRESFEALRELVENAGALDLLAITHQENLLASGGRPCRNVTFAGSAARAQQPPA
eukprot:NODE_787_length_1176_cov_64.956522_g637_i0.p3 GENE.NODE_787_length_1176_cov_64.956522_g637_i0~~NODE_787_length_1176_cov_64.956522_g637_i0.p3  ORF type:complete len:220 (+),score=78.55 NODE_787_length_1176_cov_64.956522_g637_i0:316-975(+)